MTEFTKATLTEVSDRPDAQPKDVGAPIEVQINPATLRLQMASTVDFGKDAGRQKIQYQGSTSTLSFDLLFDTADEGTTDDPLDVRTRTRQLERFVLPQMKRAKAVPPRVRFTYGSLSVVGAMTSLNQDFDFFARGGVPLRAKCAVTIKVQRPEFDASLAGPGANTGPARPRPSHPTPRARAPGRPHPCPLRRPRPPTAPARHWRVRARPTSRPGWGWTRARGRTCRGSPTRCACRPDCRSTSHPRERPSPGWASRSAARRSRCRPRPPPAGPPQHRPTAQRSPPPAG